MGPSGTRPSRSPARPGRAEVGHLLDLRALLERPVDARDPDVEHALNGLLDTDLLGAHRVRAEDVDLDLTVRGAVSIARRLMDPLAELVKIDPKSIGVGQYQHDVDQTALTAAERLQVEALQAEIAALTMDVERVGRDDQKIEADRILKHRR